ALESSPQLLRGFFQVVVGDRLIGKLLCLLRKQNRHLLIFKLLFHLAADSLKSWSSRGLNVQHLENCVSRRGLRLIRRRFGRRAENRVHKRRRIANARQRTAPANEISGHNLQSLARSGLIKTSIARG